MMFKKLILILLIIFIFVFGIALGVYIVPEKIIEKDAQINIPVINAHREMNVVGVDDKGNGVSAVMIVDVKPGTGLVLVNINDILADYLTQISARTAAKVASNFTKINLSSLDLIYSIRGNATIIEGPSAGSAMTLATIAALSEKTINNSVFITGTIDENGTIGVVGGITEKAKAARDGGAKLFLIPAAKYTIGYEKAVNCNVIDKINYCEINYLPKKIELTGLLDLNIKQVSNITEAAGYVII